MIKRLETTRLVLRNIELSDSKDIFEILSDEQTCLDDGDYPAETDISSESFIRGMKFLAIAHEHYGVVLKEENKLVGMIHLMEREEKNTIEIGFIMNKNYRRKGIMKEATCAVINDLVKNEGIKKLSMTAYDFNEASIAAIQSLGFTEVNRIPEVEHSQKGKISVVQYVKEYLD